MLAEQGHQNGHGVRLDIAVRSPKALIDGLVMHRLAGGAHKQPQKFTPLNSQPVFNTIDDRGVGTDRNAL